MQEEQRKVDVSFEKKEQKERELEGKTGGKTGRESEEKTGGKTEGKTEGMVPEREYRAVVQVFPLLHNIQTCHMFLQNHTPSYITIWRCFSTIKNKLRKSRTF